MDDILMERLVQLEQLAQQYQKDSTELRQQLADTETSVVGLNRRLATWADQLTAQTDLINDLSSKLAQSKDQTKLINALSERLTSQTTLINDLSSKLAQSKDQTKLINALSERLTSQTTLINDLSSKLAQQNSQTTSLSKLMMSLSESLRTRS